MAISGSETQKVKTLLCGRCRRRTPHTITIVNGWIWASVVCSICRRGGTQ